MTITDSSSIQHMHLLKVKIFEHQLDDVMELTDAAEVRVKLKETEQHFQQDPTEINRLRLGIIYHETALNLSFLSRTEYKGYAQKSFDHLTGLLDSEYTTRELLPFIVSYRASALSLVGAETKKLKLIGKAFYLFGDAVEKYKNISYLPEFLRGSVAENLPWIFFSKKKFAKKDFQSIIDKYRKDPNFANRKVMSFIYWAWAQQNQGKKQRDQAILYLDQAISLDPDYKAGRRKAEELKKKLMK